MIQQLLSIVLEVQNDPALLAPVNLSQNANNAIDALTFILNNIPAGPFADFIQNHFHYSVNVCSSVGNGQVIPHVIQSIAHNPTGVSDTVGVYAFGLINDINQYVGSSININTRIIDHINAIQNGAANNINAIFQQSYIGIKDNIEWGFIYTTINFLKLFLV